MSIQCPECESENVEKEFNAAKALSDALQGEARRIVSRPVDYECKDCGATWKKIE